MYVKVVKFLLDRLYRGGEEALQKMGDLYKGDNKELSSLIDKLLEQNKFREALTLMATVQVATDNQLQRALDHLGKLKPVSKFDNAEISTLTQLLGEATTLYVLAMSMRRRQMEAATQGGLVIPAPQIRRGV